MNIAGISTVKFEMEKLTKAYSNGGIDILPENNNGGK
jgi:hypothetical protein